MSRFPQIIKNGKNGYIALQSDIGLDVLILETLLEQKARRGDFKLK